MEAPVPRPGLSLLATHHTSAESRPFRVVVADDSRLVRAAVRRLLEIHGDFEVVAEASDAAETISLVDAHEPDALVLDLGMPGPGGLETVRSLHGRWPALPIVVLSMQDAEVFEQPSLAAGAAGYVSKDAADHLAECLRSAVGARA